LNGISYGSFSFVNAELTETNYSKERKENWNNRKGKENEIKKIILHKIKRDENEAESGLTNCGTRTITGAASIVYC
jgi:hypothetical protein